MILRRPKLHFCMYGQIQSAEISTFESFSGNFFTAQTMLHILRSSAQVEIEHLNTSISNFDGIQGRPNPYSRGRITRLVEGFTSLKRFLKIIYFSVTLESFKFFRFPFQFFAFSLILQLSRSSS